jgi:hemerythrin-like domain-containing protein
MLPIGPLMEEHRLIERLMPALRRAAEAGRTEGRIDIRFVELALDFIRTYADRCHHGKEEDLLFRGLEGKPLTAPLRVILDELVEEHRRGRKKVGEITAALEAYRGGAGDARTVIVGGLEWLAGFYPEHIRKEDQDFFLPVMDYLSDGEKTGMIIAERDFDRELVHVLYSEKVLQAVAMTERASGPA